MVALLISVLPQSLCTFHFLIFLLCLLPPSFHSSLLHLLFPSPPHLSRPSSLLPSGAQGAWLTSGGDTVPLQSSPDLDAFCDPEAPAFGASLRRSSPPRSSSLSAPVLFPSPHPQLPVSPSAPPAQISSGTPASSSNNLPP